MTPFVYRPRREAIERMLAAVASAFLVLALAACTSSVVPTATSSTSSTAAASAPPSTSVSATASAGRTPATTIKPSAPTKPSSSPAAEVGRCTSAHLKLALSAGAGAGAGSRFPYIVFTNTGSTSCTLYGRPGVSFVGKGDGTQLGAAAGFDTSVAATPVTLTPGGSAHAPLKIAVAENFDASSCQPSAADGLRVYAPGETHAQFIAATGYTACVNAAVPLMTVQAVQPGA